MAIKRVIIKNYKSIEKCDISLSDINVLIGENGSGKTNILQAINYFYQNLTENHIAFNIFDENNKFSNEVRITIIYDLSDFVKISKKHFDAISYFFDEDEPVKIKYSGYYKAIISMAEKSENNQIKVELSQIKGHNIVWNCSYEDRLIYKSLFPVFFIDARELDVAEWGRVWEVLGELAKVSNAERKNIEDDLNSVILDEKKDISNKIKHILDIFENADVSVKRTVPKEFAKYVAKIFFSGEIIEQSGKRPGYYSTGTGSIKYIELLLKSIDELSKVKMKEPLVLLDEPEIGLHTSLLDELSSSINNNNRRVFSLISTHSPRMIKNFIKSQKDTQLYHVKLVSMHTGVKRMKKFLQYSPSSRYRVMDDHMNSYFSKAVLFVEGETELELFDHPVLKMLYPSFAKIDIFKAVSDKPILNIMNPKLLQNGVPYVCLIDLDKALAYDKSKRQFCFRKEYICDNSKEKFLYANKHDGREVLLHQHKRIDAWQKNYVFIIICHI